MLLKKHKFNMFVKGGWKEGSDEKALTFIK